MRGGRLKQFESFVKAKAKSFARRPADEDDFYQEGMLAAWQALEDDPDATKSYVYRRIEWRMIDHMKRRIYKNPEEFSTDDHYSNLLYGRWDGTDE